ncbi:MAG: nucleotidyl transferase AbiEii/AbiGii toxin family protein [Cyanobacteria bacterium P01_G01_bin.54]
MTDPRFLIHQQVQTILNGLNALLFAESQAYFGGGTVLAMELDEYRQSHDIDFICPIATSGYRNLRKVIFEQGYEALFSDLQLLHIGRAKTDQYGIRLLVTVSDMPIKLEIIAEARFVPTSPRYLPWTDVPCLSWADCFTSKLLSNADRFMDESVLSRDLIDLAMLRSYFQLPEGAIAKAEAAYEVLPPLKIAIRRFQARPDYRERCYDQLQISAPFLPRIADGLDLLAEDLNLPPLERLFKEQEDIFS